jgi:hypothetical protein
VLSPSHLLSFLLLLLLLQPPTTPHREKKRKSTPVKRAAPSVRDRSNSSIKEQNSNSHLSDPRSNRSRSKTPNSPVPAVVEHARNRKNTASVVGTRLIDDFFSAAVSNPKKRRTEQSTDTHEIQVEDLQRKCRELEQSLQDKEDQLKAISNNRTILHVALETALQKKEQELKSLHQTKAAYESKCRGVVEGLMREQSHREALQVREKLATDGARLGRLVQARTGMRSVETWEDGYASKDLRKRKQDLANKRSLLEKRYNGAKDDLEKNGKGKPARLDDIEAFESAKYHLQSLKADERTLVEEEKRLSDEKCAHIRALKRVASEDASRFNTRPKVCI